MDLANNSFTKIETQNGEEFKLFWTIKPGQHLLLKEYEEEDLKLLLKEDLYNFSNRLYKIETVSPQFSKGYLYHYTELKYHIEARADKKDKLPKRSGKINFKNALENPLLRLNVANTHFLVQGKDFKLAPDGEIVWLND